MRCLFCDERMLQDHHRLGAPVTLPGRGVAHSGCAERDLVEKRVFGGISLKDIPVEDLYELRELVLQEVNMREGRNSEEPELF